MDPTTLRNIVQAIIQSAKEPVSLNELYRVFKREHGVQTADIQEAIEELFKENNPTQELKTIAGGYRYLIKQEYVPWIQKAQLTEYENEISSRALTEVLAIIAYKQPISRGEIEWVRGRQTSTEIYQQLEEREWIRVVGYSGEHNRAGLYGTTKGFLTYFGLNSICDLPDLEEVLRLEDPNENEIEASIEEEGVDLAV